jgi:hypothetical protein
MRSHNVYASFAILTADTISFLDNILLPFYVASHNETYFDFRVKGFFSDFNKFLFSW